MTPRALIFAAAAAAGLATNIPFSVMIKLGQDYLPSRPGTATGVTLGLAVSIGGLFAPVLGAIAEAQGIAAVFTVLCFVPGLALILGAFLPDPAAPVESAALDGNTGNARSRRAPAGRRGTPRSPCVSLVCRRTENAHRFPARPRRSADGRTGRRRDRPA